MRLPPYAVRFGDAVLPKPISGHPALELCNTYAGWADEPGHEWLTGYGKLAAWAEFTGLIGPAAPLDIQAHTERARRALADVCVLRSALYRVLGDADANAFADVATFADEANALRRFTRDLDGAAGFRLPSTEDVRLPLLAAALAAVDLLDSKERTTVRACPGDSCGWLFLDPRGRRVWCSMAACGNRAKVRAHAARQRVNK
ncbi:MAG: hypothetical protein GEV28_34050 [Actinophytocola sp.]|uniref:CGNR zinc finger domain-containing protein n=1 Tax=Actinophytocola sp. TaxID=1872138 RepID=UPI001321EDD6|nr:CGNR zinc finger domain-containing protein [Actinophytocola sp.]MPZ85142.1 hypothetical protein [Actinophytocola sp.]